MKLALTDKTINKYFKFLTRIGYQFKEKINY